MGGHDRAGERLLPLDHAGGRWHLTDPTRECHAPGIAGALINTAAVIGFGGVITHTAGFARFTELMLESGLPPLVSMFSPTNPSEPKNTQSWETGYQPVAPNPRPL